MQTLFNKATEELKKKTEPFFSCILTQSTHRPYDLDANFKFGKNNRKEKHKSTAYFVDSCLFNFIEKNKKETWFNNTLFIIISDHGSLVFGKHFNDHRRFKIPCLFFGNVLKEEYKGSKITPICNQHDFSATLLSLLNIKSNDYLFSKNLFRSNNYNSAYWITEHTLGWLTDKQQIVINHDTEELYFAKVKGIENKDFINDALGYYKLVADYVLKNNKK